MTPDHDALNEHIAFLEPHGLHGGVGRLQADPAAGFAVELLDGGLGAVDQRDDHFAVLGGLPAMHHHEVAIADMLVDHRVALNPQRVVGPAPREHIVGDGDRLLVHQRLDREARGHLAQKRDLGRRRRAAGRQNLDGAAFVVGPPDVALALEVGEVLVHRGERLEAEVLGDFLEARGVALIWICVCR